MQERVKASKRAVNLSIDAELLDAAKAAGADLTAVLENALRAQLRTTKRDEWLAENKAAIDASNRELEANGMWYTPDWLAK